MVWIWVFIRPILPLHSEPTQKLLILGIDGCRPDALLQCKAPNLRSLAHAGIYTWHGLSRPPTKSGPCWSSIFTGVWNDKHGVTDNTFAHAHFDRYPMLFKRLHDSMGTFSSGWFVYWPDLATVMPHGASEWGGNWSDLRTLEKAKAMLENGNPDALFVHFGGIDAVGHGVGFDPNHPKYLAEIEKVDSLVGEVLSAMRARPSYAEEDWMVIALTDHGGFQTHHGGSTIDEMRIFFIVWTRSTSSFEIPHAWRVRSHEVPRYGLALDGIDDAIVIPDTSLFHVDLSQNFTVELNLNTSRWSGSPVLFANKDMRDPKNRGFAIVLIDEGKWRVNVGDGKKYQNISGPVIADGLWHHLAIVFEKKKVKLYQDGIFTGALDISEIERIDTEWGMAIGQDPLFSQKDFPPVKLNEIRIWATALPDSVLGQWMWTPIRSTHPEWSHLLGYWKLQKDSSNGILDSGPSALHGTFRGGTPEWIDPHATVQTLCFDSCQTLKTVDLVPIALSHFGISILPEWGLDGKGIFPMDTVGSEVSPHPNIQAKEIPLELWPNPCYSQCHIQGVLSDHVVIQIFDLLGRRMATLYEGAMPAKGTELDFSKYALPSGMYLIRVGSPEISKIQKVIILH